MKSGLDKRFLDWFLVIPGVIVMISLAWIYPSNAVAERESQHAQQRKPATFPYDPDAWERLARDGDVEAQFLLGLLHSDGARMPLNYGKAFFWYHEAARRNHLNAQYNLAHLYLNGKGVEQDLGQAIHWWRRAAESGHVQAQYNLGFAYLRGIGVEQDHRQALMWIRRAARRNDARALKLLPVVESEAASSRDKTTPPVADPGRSGAKTTPANVVGRIHTEAGRTRPARSSPSPKTQRISGPTGNNAWLFSQPAEFFTAQLISSTKRSDVADYIFERALQGQARVFKTARNGEDWWYLLLGSYPTRQAAIAAVESMSIEAESVWIRRFAGLHEKRCQTLASINSASVGQFCP